ncbi:Transcription initiation factor TFIID subunit 11 [Wickerhamomyces ciferrii]|uniref:Transcription initiation factor TFIID subunit 11 n=1 Tax=Wickerhamomyces ciferrii (strain ATCC 14091 / BCRC 22168 / CBS 111 / JCM 3599 / NBRC 0793 / NRRL Y-1031 F-60-10) TaxID=1206466 RepID=K0KI53_WICCF|nr:Transcription initiation factor TFIID subunit 11 [Wickerhamomyces ciferrii]CCH40818.1 Transcription initiation factor TFIID subunit 11 [Wickerhamomyces ciferrii]
MSNLEEDEDLQLSDVPMDENDNGSDLNSSQDESEVEELFSDLLDEESEFINRKIFESVLNGKKVTLEEEDIPEEPEEELDEEERLRLLMDHLDRDQMSRYEYYRRTTVNRGGVKKIANTVLNQSVSNNVAIVLSGVSKVFMGEIIEKARNIKLRYDKANYINKLNEKRELYNQLKKEYKETKRNGITVEEMEKVKKEIEIIKNELKKLDLKKVNENGPLQPEHIREAWRLYQLESGTNPSGQWRHQGERDGLMFR